MSLLKDRFAASDRFVKAVGQRIWFADKIRNGGGSNVERTRGGESGDSRGVPNQFPSAKTGTWDVANRVIEACGRVVAKRGLPCIVVPEDVEREAS